VNNSRQTWGYGKFPPKVLLKNGTNKRSQEASFLCSLHAGQHVLHGSFLPNLEKPNLNEETHCVWAVPEKTHFA